jgi:hypothetical protein
MDLSLSQSILSQTNRSVVLADGSHFSTGGMHVDIVNGNTSLSMKSAELTLAGATLGLGVSNISLGPNTGFRISKLYYGDTLRFEALVDLELTSGDLSLNGNSMVLSSGGKAAGNVSVRKIGDDTKIAGKLFNLSSPLHNGAIDLGAGGSVRFGPNSYALGSKFDFSVDGGKVGVAGNLDTLDLRKVDGNLAFPNFTNLSVSNSRVTFEHLTRNDLGITSDLSINLNVVDGNLNFGRTVFSMVTGFVNASRLHYSSKATSPMSSRIDSVS